MAVWQHLPLVWGFYHNRCQVLAFKATDGVVQRFVHGCGDPLGDQAVQVDGATQQLQDRNNTNESLVWSRGRGF